MPFATSSTGSAVLKTKVIQVSTEEQGLSKAVRPFNKY